MEYVERLMNAGATTPVDVATELKLPEWADAKRVER